MSSKARKFAVAMSDMAYVQGFLFAIKRWSLQITTADNDLLRDMLKTSRNALADILDDPPTESAPVDRDAKGRFA